MERDVQEDLRDPDYDIHSSASMAEVRTHVLKHAESFVVFDNHGDLTPVGNGEQGVYHDGTRYVSRLELWLAGQRPVLLNSSVCKDNTLLTVDLTNPDMEGEDGRHIPHGMIHVFRACMLWEKTLYQHIRVRNYGTEDANLRLTFHIDADFRDIFEIRGTRRSHRGRMLEPEMTPGRLISSYEGLDGRMRRTSHHLSPQPDDLDAATATYKMQLKPGESQDLYVNSTCVPDSSSGDGSAPTYDYQEARIRLAASRTQLKNGGARIETSHEQFNAWLNRSFEDLELLTTEVPEGYYPYAGIPWYNTVFGRDGLLTALMALWINPDIARGVLAHLSKTQAQVEDPDRVAEPGKILHEARGGEMAELGEVPFKQYYGTVDATPLYVLLSGEYHKHTGDTEFIRSHWASIERALEWIDSYGDVDGDGFVEYRYHEGGLTQQGWKDSDDSVFYEDGTIARDPIALAEVQAYVYAAKTHAARLADELGHVARGKQLLEQAQRLRERFEAAFWDEELGTYVLALDGKKRPCRVCTSNAGHVLFARMASPDRARRTVESLFSEDSFAGWGIRTLSEKESRFNPMSYHNGSVWPHDNAIIGYGLSHYGNNDEIHTLMKAFLDASAAEHQDRLPELFCGFIRRPGVGPTPYPVACAPQAWATTVVFALLQASLGLTIDAAGRCVQCDHPSLPAWLDHVTVRNMRVGDGTIDLRFVRHELTVSVRVLRRDSGIAVQSIW